MSNNINIPMRWTDDVGNLTTEARIFLDELVNGGQDYSIGSILSGVQAAKQLAEDIRDGEQPLAAVTITGTGDVSDQLDALLANLAAQSGNSGGALSASLDRISAFGSGSGTVTTNSVTVTPTGGTGPYTYAWTKDAGDTFTIDAPTAATTTFSEDPPGDDTLSGTYCCTVTDSVSDTFDVTVSVTISGG